QLPPAQPLPPLNFGIRHVISQLLLEMPPDNYETCLSLHFYPIPSPALPLKGREIGTALHLKGGEIGTALHLKGGEIGAALHLKGREIGAALPFKGREIGAALPFKGREAATTASITHYKPHRAK
ncbi:MAG: hypothetical protein Q8O31_00095, partial [Rhodocyclaceae bacterium]|nr:hypothetical protein [Rhodocyclaceae bacterium]